MRLIDADALIEVLQNREIHAENVDKRIAIKGDRQVVINAPTIPIRASAILLPPHAEWIRWVVKIEDETGVSYIPHAKCSNCGNEQESYTTQFINFCPNCGAKMDRERSEE